MIAGFGRPIDYFGYMVIPIFMIKRGYPFVK